MTPVTTLLVAALGGVLKLGGDAGAIEFTHAKAKLTATCNTGESASAVGMIPTTLSLSDFASGTPQVTLQLSGVAPTCSEGTFASHLNQANEIHSPTVTNDRPLASP